MTLCRDLMGQFRSNLNPKNVFICLILQEFYNLFGTWDFCLFVFLRMQSLQKFQCLAIFLFFGGKLGPEMDQNRKILI